MAGDKRPGHPARWTPIDRRRVVETLTFWLRPDFILRTVNRFQRVGGVDRAIALASSALTALIPQHRLARGREAARDGARGATVDEIEGRDEPRCLEDCAHARRHHPAHPAALHRKRHDVTV